MKKEKPNGLQVEPVGSETIASFPNEMLRLTRPLDVTGKDETKKAVREKSKPPKTESSR